MAKFRFVHASDLHLEQVPQGVPDVPAHLRELFREAPFRAAQKVFDLVLAEKAEFLILTGDVLDPRAAGLRGVLFLLEQFQRLANSGVPVYWASGRSDRADAWPAGFPLPENVHRFPVGKAEKFVHVRGEGEPLAQLIGTSAGSRPLAPQDLAQRHPDLFTVAVAVGDPAPEHLRTHLIDCWTLGGRHQPAALPLGPRPSGLLSFAGTPQGRSPEESGPHGAMVIEVDSEEPGSAQARFVATDVLRYVARPVSIGAATTASELESRLRALRDELRAANPEVELLVRWTIAADAPLGDAGLSIPLRRGPMAADLLAKLQREAPAQRPGVWPIALDVDPSMRLATARFEEPTMLGDLLRLVWRHFDAQADETPSPHPATAQAILASHDDGSDEELEAAEILPADDDLLAGEDELDFSWLMGMGPLVEQWPDLAGPDPQHKRQMLREVAGLSVDLLGGG